VTDRINYGSLALGAPAPISVFAAGPPWGDYKMMHWLIVAVIGVLAGWIASMILNRRHGLWVNLLIGLVGALIGSWLNDRFIHFAPGGLSPFLINLCVAIVGSVILLLILSLFRPRRV
jgi:uncharacterized membrane protein YeaQ/YmgE (transglycosylase-associated protein family)